MQYSRAETEPAPRPVAPSTAARLRVAFQGEPGAFSEDAIHLLWGPGVEAVPVATFAAVMDAAEQGDVDFGMLPIESTVLGDVHSAYDLLAMHDGLVIAAEVILPVRLALMALPGARLAQIRSVASHPLILAQCTYYLERHSAMRAVPAEDTAGAAREVAESGDRSRAALGSRRAAEYYGLDVIADGVEDRPDAQFRFLAVGCEPASLERGALARTAVLCVFPDAAGSLVSALKPLADASFRITHIGARPTREPWTYQFFLEYEHPAMDPHATAALYLLQTSSRECRLLGTYPKWVDKGSAG